MVLLWLLHVARGVSDFGLQTAIVGGRPWLYFLAPMAFAATVPTGWNTRIWKLFAVAGMAVAAISIPYLLVDGIQPASHLILRDGQLISGRPITAQGALLVLEAAIILLALRWPSPRVSVVLAALAFADIVPLSSARYGQRPLPWPSSDFSAGHVATPSKTSESYSQLQVCF